MGISYRADAGFFEPPTDDELQAFGFKMLLSSVEEYQGEEIQSHLRLRNTCVSMSLRRNTVVRGSWMCDANDRYRRSAPGRAFVGQAMRCFLPMKPGDGAAAVLIRVSSAVI